MTGTQFNVADFEASGVARPGETLRLTHLEWKWIRYPAGTAARIYRRQADQPLDSVGIQRAIEAAAEAGGGTVFVPAGHYLIGPIDLRSNVELHLAAGAYLWGSPDLTDYAGSADQTGQFAVEQSFGRHEMRQNRRLISAVDAHDVAITGLGQISGQSPAFVIPWMNDRPVGVIMDRPSDTILFCRCQHVRVEGVRIVDAPNWTLVFDACRHVAVRGITIHCFDVINSDGIDLVDTTDAVISDCSIWCCDDAICLKSTKADAFTARIAVTNCVIRTLCNSLKFGTDSAGVFEDIAVSNLVISNPMDDAPGSERGSINLNAIDGGVIRNVSINNVVMRNAHCPFYLIAGCRTLQQKRYRTPRAGTINGVSITHLRASGTLYPAFIFGGEQQRITDVYLTDIAVEKTRGAATRTPPPLPAETGERYPTPYLFGTHGHDGLPAFALFVKSADRVTVRDFRVDTVAEEVRPFLVADESDELVASGLRTNLHRRELVHAEPTGPAKRPIVEREVIV